MSVFDFLEDWKTIAAGGSGAWMVGESSGRTWLLKGGPHALDPLAENDLLRKFGVTETETLLALDEFFTEHVTPADLWHWKNGTFQPRDVLAETKTAVVDRDTYIEQFELERDQLQLCGKCTQFGKIDHYRTWVNAGRFAGYYDVYGICRKCGDKRFVVGIDVEKYFEVEALPDLRDYRPPRPVYSEYIKSPEWREKAKRARNRAGKKCQVCGCSSPPLHVHHNTYERLGEEDNKDLVTLCARCHKLFHGVVKPEQLGECSHG